MKNWEFWKCVVITRIISEAFHISNLTEVGWSPTWNLRKYLKFWMRFWKSMESMNLCNGWKCRIVELFLGNQSVNQTFNIYIRAKIKSYSRKLSAASYESFWICELNLILNFSKRHQWFLIFKSTKEKSLI